MTASSIQQPLKREAIAASRMICYKAPSASLGHLANRTHLSSSCLTRSSWLASSPGIFPISWKRTTSHTEPSIDTRPFIRACSSVPLLPSNPKSRIPLGRALAVGGGSALALYGYYRYNQNITKTNSGSIVKEEAKISQVSVGQGKNVAAGRDINYNKSPESEKKNSH
jgi:hypothetical protein